MFCLTAPGVLHKCPMVLVGSLFSCPEATARGLHHWRSPSPCRPLTVDALSVREPGHPQYFFASKLFSFISTEHPTMRRTQQLRVLASNRQTTGAPMMPAQQRQRAVPDTTAKPMAPLPKAPSHKRPPPPTLFRKRAARRHQLTLALLAINSERRPRERDRIRAVSRKNCKHRVLVVAVMVSTM